MTQLNCLSLQLLQEGWTKDQTPPGCREWKDYYGGWEYDGKTVAALTFETPCGLLASGSHWVSGHISEIWTPGLTRKRRYWPTESERFYVVRRQTMALIEQEAAIKTLQEHGVATCFGTHLLKNLPTTDPIRAAGGCRCGECMFHRDIGCTHAYYDATGNLCFAAPHMTATDGCTRGVPREAQDDG